MEAKLLNQTLIISNFKTNHDHSLVRSHSSINLTRKFMFQLFYNYAQFMPVINPVFLILFLTSWLKRKQDKWRLIPCAVTLLITLYHAAFIIALPKPHINLPPLLSFSVLHPLNLVSSAYFIFFALSNTNKGNIKMRLIGFAYAGILLLYSFVWVALLSI